MVESTAASTSINSTFDINIYLDDVDDLYGASVDFIFDSSIVKVLNNGDTPSFLEKSNFSAPYFELRKIEQANNKSAYSFVKCLTGKEPGVNINTKTLLCSIPLKSVGKGNVKINVANYDDKITSLDLSENTLLIHLANSSAEPIYYSSPQGSNVTVHSNDSASTSTGRDSSGGSSGIPAETISETIASNGGQIVHNNVTLEIPPDVFKKDEQLKISKITDTVKLPVAKNHKLVSEVVEILRDNTGNFAKPVMLTISFNRSEVDLDNYLLSICWLDEEKGKWVELDNVEIDFIHNTVSGEVTHFTKFAILAKPKETKAPLEITVLTDIQEHWAKESIDKLLTLEILTGYPDSTFKPDNSISRAEFTKILVQAFKLESLEQETQFNDTISHWANQYISTAAAHGVVNGYNANYFHPDDCITREQMAAMITRAANLEKPDHNITFEDSNQISNWAKDAVNQAAESGIICGYPDNTFKPQNNLTRAEAAVVFERVLK